MVYKVKLEVFEGPFDLLLHLISRQKVDIREVPIARVTDDYLRYIDRMEELDLEVASDFLLVAATLLELKAAALLPQPEEVPDLDDLSAAESRDVLIARLIEYRTFKQAAAELEARAEVVARLHHREAGLEERFVGLLPEFLEGVQLEELAFMCARLLSRPVVSIVDASHIAAMPVSLERRIDEVLEQVLGRRRMAFSDIVRDWGDRTEVVVAFLALLELHKRGMLEFTQLSTFGDIEVEAVRGAA